MVQLNRGSHFESQTWNLEISQSVLSNHYSAKSSDHLSDGADPGFCFTAFLPKISAGFGCLHRGGNQRRTGWVTCAAISSTVTVGTDFGSDRRQDDAGNFVRGLVDERRLPRTNS